jgi:hypothetical protein
MADRYWVGGTDTWDATAGTKWALTSGGAGGLAAPTMSDVVFFDSNSGSGTCTTASGATAQSVVFNTSTITLTLGANLPLTTTFTLTAGALNLNNNTLSGNFFASATANTRSINFGTTGKIVLSGSNGTVWQGPNAGTTNVSILGTSRVELSYAGATNTRSIRSGLIGLQTDPINFYITAGTDTIAITGSNILGNLDFTGFSGTFTNAIRTIFGNLNISSGMTLTAGSSITFFAATTGTQQITTNGKTIDFPITFNGVGGTFAFQDALTQGSTRAFTIINGTVQLKNGVTSTVGSFVANNSNIKFLRSTTPGSQATLSQASGTVNVVDLTIQDINAVGGAAWNAYTDFENTDAGNNDGWNFSLSPPYSVAELPIALRPFTQPRRF